ncbi:PepSY domain-containing protein [Vibrio makurazakiensis]|uniref:PepSY-associated TM helix domain-containing protein n=1 Tax=Vibrio makurazakiensis TaxID=2910250 RepID=UPI003D12BA37
MLRNDSQVKQSSQEQTTSRNKTLYFLTWRWHFYAGLFVIPFMLMLCLTGLVMLFDDEIEMVRYQDILQVEASNEKQTPSEQLQQVQAIYPNAVITQYIPAKTPTLANRYSVKRQDGSSVFAIVNPYTGEVLGEIDRSDSWYQLANDIHGTLLIGDWGDYLIEVAASLSVLLLVSGIYLWLPRDNASRAGFMKIRLGAGTRVVMRDLHANIGGTLSLVLLLFILSGLSWAGVWGSQFVQAWNSFPAQKWNDVPLSDQNHTSLNHGSEEEMPWNLEQTPLPKSHDHSAMGDMSVDLHHSQQRGTLSLNEVVKIAQDLGFGQYKLNFPKSETGVFTVSANTMSGDITNPTQDRTTHIDQYSGQILADVTWQDYNLMAKAMAAGVALHQGDISVVNKILNTLFCIAFIAVAITGGVMWWMRRPSGQKKLGAPPKFNDAGVWKTGLVVIAFMGILFPLAGITIVTALILDWLIFSRVERLKLALS